MSEATLSQVLTVAGTAMLMLLLATIGALMLVAQMKARDGRTAAGRDRANRQRRRAEALDRFLFREGLTLEVTGMGDQTQVEISGEDLRPVALRRDPRDPWHRKPQGRGNSLQSAKGRAGPPHIQKSSTAGPGADGRRQVRVPDCGTRPNRPPWTTPTKPTVNNKPPTGKHHPGHRRMTP